VWVTSVGKPDEDQAGGPIIEKPPARRVRRVVHHNDFDGRVGLGAHGLERFVERRLGVPEGDDARQGVAPCDGIAAAIKVRGPGVGPGGGERGSPGIRCLWQR
jgi:hypothetical protein